MEVLITKPPKLLWAQEIRKFLNNVGSFSPRAAVLIGWCGFNTELIRELRERKYFLITSPYDDIAITKEARKQGILLDGKIVKIEKLAIGGIGGLNPSQDIERLSKLLSSEITLDVLVSYHPPYKCGDFLPALGIRRGLKELVETITKLKPSLLISGGNTAEVCRIGKFKAVVLGERLNSVKLTFQNSLISLGNFFRLP